MSRLEWNKEQIAAAASDLCERAARMLRADPLTRHGRTIARSACWLGGGGSDRAPIEYAYCLGLAGVNSAERDAAVAAISEGRHPPDSLPGRLAEAYQDADEGHNDHDLDDHRVRGVPVGRLNALAAALEWIGAKR